MLPCKETIWGREPASGAWTPYLTRVSWGPFFLHVFHRGDGDPDLHDHRRAFWTFPLTGYVEEVLVFPRVIPWLTPLRRPGCEPPDAPQPRLIRVVVRPFRLHRREARHAHRLVGRWNGLWRHRRTALGLRRRLEPDLGARPGPIITIGLWDQSEPPRPWGFWKRIERWRASFSADGEPAFRRLSDGYRWVPWRRYIFGEDA